MIHLNYAKDAVLAMFFMIRHKVNPSTEDIQKFDAALKSANEQLLVEHMTAAGLDPADLAIKSRILLYSQKAPGGSAADQISNAVVFFTNTRAL